MKPKSNQLTHEQSYKLARWIEQHNDELVKTRATYCAVSVQATKELGFYITEANVYHAARVVGGKWMGGNASTPESRKDSKRASRTIAQAVVRLYRELGIEIPDDLYRVATGKDQNKTND